MVDPVEAGRQVLGLNLAVLLHRDVAGDFGGADDLAGGVSDGGDCDRNVDQAPVFAPAYRIEMPDRLPGGDDGHDPGLLIETVRREQLGDRLADHFGGSVAEN